MRIIELDAIKALLAAKISVVAVGGGGIPVIQHQGGLKGIAAVIDKDFASSLLAAELKADLFVISTAVPQAYLNFGKPDQKPLGHMTAAEAEQYMAAGHFARGSMAPKVQAILDFLAKGGGHAIITEPGSIPRALEGKAGTHLTSL